MKDTTLKSIEAELERARRFFPQPVEFQVLDEALNMLYHRLQEPSMALSHEIDVYQAARNIAVLAIRMMEGS